MAIINTGPAIMSDWKERLAEAVGAGEVLEDSRRNIELFLGGTKDERAEDAVAELERYTMGYVDSYLHDGREMLREARQRRQRLQQERRRLEIA